MKVLVCPNCGLWPAIDVSIPQGKDPAGFTIVKRIVRCPKCGNSLEGNPRETSFLVQLSNWKANLKDMQEEE